MQELGPLRLEPIYKQYVWGGRRFATQLGRRLPEGGVFAESWEVADLAAEQSAVSAGPNAGMSMHKLVVERGEELLGRHAGVKRFPLLLKYLDAQQNLSVQVHPDDATAAAMGLVDPGKTEAWVILHAEPGSAVWAGFCRRVDVPTVQEAIAAGRLTDLLHRFEPAAGDCIFVPAGTVHALGAGLLVAEIQQPSDNTFRLFDWKRVDSEGRPRPLHVEPAIAAINYAQGPIRPVAPELVAPRRERLAGCDKFILERRTISAAEKVGGDGRCHVISVLQGAVNLADDPAGRPLMRAETALLPAGLGEVGAAAIDGQSAVILDAYLP